MSKKVIIVGGVAGGASAAARLRRLDETAHIIMFERDEYISFANCGLPYYIGNTIQDRSKLIVQTPEAMTKRFNLDIRTRSEVISIDPDAKKVTVRSLEHGTYEETYDALVLSPGARPIRPELPGIDLPHIYSVRNIPDTDRIKQQVISPDTRSAIVIGGGYIGVEMAENLKLAGLEVTLVQSGPQIMNSFDPEMAGMLAKEMEEQGVQLILNDKVRSFKEHGVQVEALLESGQTLHSDIVILAVGVAPDTGFLTGSGIKLGARGHIQVNEALETNVEGVYAVGDAVEIHAGNGKTAIPLAGPANKQGRIAADRIAGLSTTYSVSQGTSIIKVFDVTGAQTGLSEKTLKLLGLAYHAVYIHPNAHAAYYPGATPLTMKLLFDSEGKILGASAVGRTGVDKRIDDIAAVLHFGGTVTDLTELDLAYAPPFSSAKDPVNMLGYVAENVVTGKTTVYVSEDLQNRNPDTTLLVDVRSELEHQNGHIPDSVNIPVDELRDRLSELDRNKEIWVYCQVGLRGYTSARILQQHGYRVRNLTGGYKTYMMNKFEPKKPDRKEASTEIGQKPESPAKEKGSGTESRSGSAVTASPASVPVVEKESSIPEGMPIHANMKLDACGLSCPGPLVEAKQAMDGLAAGQILHITATDPGFYEDVQSFARMSGHEVLSVIKQPNGEISAHLKKDGVKQQAAVLSLQNESQAFARPEGTTMVVFSGDLDKAIASFIIANGAAASGKKVTLFFTFWGLNILRKTEPVDVKKNFMGRMFGMMMPRGSRKLGLSRMNMLGAGSKMIRSVMKRSNISSLEELMDTAVSQGVELVACQMSMDVMGIKHEELIDGVKIGGVGYYLGQADQSGINLFI
ncbi:FAD-dependent oxidoreductase [Paenibacillus shunpengii]|uniref:FAD-dependent oxidoreductase n=1 Tax=Paenibacillus shunpengii TaxID=2054424 RepID=A0ABW5SQU1_9BACL|nr:FAD-dependent oxidoreductase [Paenibacillus sp. PDC88]SDX21905.1 NADPH-dependent 2,4-dienoyl-CoA reductase, sulfur reductase [Paenibacillus sp. PDC88]